MDAQTQENIPFVVKYIGFFALTCLYIIGRRATEPENDDYIVVDPKVYIVRQQKFTNSLIWEPMLITAIFCPISLPYMIIQSLFGI